MQQELTIDLLSVIPVSIHGSVYYDLEFQVEGQAKPKHMRINPEAFYPNPQPGDRVKVNLLMGNIMGAEKLI